MEALHIGEAREMISIKHLKSGKRGAATVTKYAERSTEAEGAAGYYKSESDPSRCLSHGTAALGLQGAVRREDLIAVLEGRQPDGTGLSAGTFFKTMTCNGKSISISIDL